MEFFENHDKYLSFAPDYNIIKVPSGLLDYYKDLFSNNEVIDIIDEDIIYEDGWFLNQDKTELISSYGFDDDSDIAIPEGIVLVRNKSLYQIAMLSDVKIHFPKSINSITGDALLNNSDLELYVPKGARGWYLSIFPELEDNIIEE